MSKKSKGVVSYEDAKARLRHETLMQDYQDLQKEVDTIRSKLEAGKQRKMMLAAEVRFLRRRHEYFVKTKTMNSSQKEKPILPPELLKQTTRMKEFGRKEARQRMFPEAKPMKKQYIGKESGLCGTPVKQHRRRILHGKEATQESLAPFSNWNHKGRIDNKKKTLFRNTTLVLDMNEKERMQANGNALRNTIAAFDLNQDNSSSGKDVSFPSRARIFDLNEISTGDEDFPSNVEAVKFEEAKRSLMRHPDDELQNDLMLSICRNAGEGPSRVGKRKISWQDPVALRV